MDKIPKIYLAISKDSDGIPHEPYLMVTDELPRYYDQQWNHESETVIPENIFKAVPSLMELEEDQLFEVEIKPIKRITIQTLIQEEEI